MNHDEEVLVKVLVDLYVMEASLKDIEFEEKDSLEELYTKQLETIHKIDFTAIQTDIELIQAQPDYYKKIHTRVKDTLSSISKELH